MGRPRQYDSDAERVQAYRERKRRREEEQARVAAELERQRRAEQQRQDDAYRRVAWVVEALYRRHHGLPQRDPYGKPAAPWTDIVAWLECVDGVVMTPVSGRVDPAISQL